MHRVVRTNLSWRTRKQACFKVRALDPGSLDWVSIHIFGTYSTFTIALHLANLADLSFNIVHAGKINCFAWVVFFYVV